MLLAQAALTTPTTARGFAVKARIVQVWADDARAGAMVGRYLLADLMARGGVQP